MCHGARPSIFMPIDGISWSTKKAPEDFRGFFKLAIELNCQVKNQLLNHYFLNLNFFAIIDGKEVHAFGKIGINGFLIVQ